jgi:hypothetical protein
MDVCSLIWSRPVACDVLLADHDRYITIVISIWDNDRYVVKRQNCDRYVEAT